MEVYFGTEEVGLVDLPGMSNFQEVTVSIQLIFNLHPRLS